MRTKIGCVAVMAGMMGIAMEAEAGENNVSLAGKRGRPQMLVFEFTGLRGFSRMAGGMRG